jgi:hypothetical protein
MRTKADIEARRFTPAGFCLPIEQIRWERVIYHAQNQADYRPNENATRRARLDNDDTNDGNGRKGEEGATTKARTNKDGSNPRREGENNAAQLLAETARSPEGNLRQLTAGVDFPIEIAKVRQPFHRQAVFVLFALNVLFHQILGKPFAGSLRLGTVCKSAVYAQRAING